MTSVICIIIISVFSAVFFPAISAITQDQELARGSSCRLQTSEKQGVCKLVSECPSAIAQIKKQQFPQLCGFEGDTAIICCVESSQKIIRKSLEKCNEYVKGIESLAPNDRPKPKSGGRAVRNEFPHMALLGFQLENGEELWPCGGSLISERYVLTTATCVGSRSTGDVRWIKLGHLKRNDIDGVQQVGVEQIIKHPDYKPPSRYHNIALLRTDRTIVFGPNVRPGCLYSGVDLPGKSFTNIKAVATGWGRKEYGGEISDELLKVTLDQFTYEDCNKSYNNVVKSNLIDGIVPDLLLCYGSYTHGSDTCQGDSGGPLQIKREGPCCSYDLIGITSFGKACGIAAVPGVYTKISYYVPWIESIVWP